MFNRKENPRPVLCALPLVFGISIFLFTLSLAYSDDRSRHSAKYETANEKPHDDGDAKRLNLDRIRSQKEDSETDEESNQVQEQKSNTKTVLETGFEKFINFFRFPGTQDESDESDKESKLRPSQRNSTTGQSRSQSQKSIHQRRRQSKNNHRNNKTRINKTKDLGENSNKSSDHPENSEVNKSNAVTSNPANGKRRENQPQYPQRVEDPTEGENSTFEKYGNDTVDTDDLNSTVSINTSINASNASINVDKLSVNKTVNNSSKPCPECKKSKLTEEDIIAIRTAEFKELLLKKLRLTEKSVSLNNGNGGDSPQEPIIDLSKLPPEVRDKTLRDNARQEDIEEFYSHDQQLMVQGYDLKNRCIASKYVTGCYLFDLTGKIRGDVASAQIWFYKTPDYNDNGGQTIRVLEVGKKRRRSRYRSRHTRLNKGTRRTRRAARKSKEVRGSLVATKLLTRHETMVRQGWISVNVTGFVGSSWTKTVMIAIQCRTCYTLHHRALYGYKAGYKPLLVVNYETTSMISRKRRTVVDNCNPEVDCCKKELEIDFDRIGWPRIIAPESLSIGYCHGACRPTMAYRYNYTTLNQAARFHDPHLDQATRQELVPCCIPITMRDTFLLYNDADGMSQKAIPNVIVASCGCV